MTNTLFTRKKLRAGTALQSLALLGAGVVMSATFAAPASAQDYTNVTASGRVQSTNGQPIAGATVTLVSDQGYTRTLTTDNSGNFRAPQVPQGTYTITVAADGFDTFTDSNVSLSQAGAANQFTLAPAGEAAAADIVVTAGRVQVADFEKTTTGAVINVGDLATRVPVARSLRDVILLAPGSIQGSSAQNANFAGQATISGSSFAENAYYINGLNITEFRQGFSPVTIPFDFYQTVEVKDGGIPAEFGRFTGGFVNATTKSGSNEFHGSVLFNWQPDELSGHAPNTYNADNEKDLREREETVFQLSGPIIKDHLFFYGLYNTRSIKQGDGTINTANHANSRYSETTDKSPFWGGKLDALWWGQHLEFTYFDTTDQNFNRQYVYNSDTNTIGRFASGSSSRAGGENYVGRYTGTITNWLTLSAAYGVNNNRAGTLPLNTTLEAITDQRNGTPASIGNSVSSITTNDDKREFYRGDVDLSFKLLGSHHIRFGYDHEKLTATQVAQTIGIGSVTISRFDPATSIDVFGLATGTDYVSARTFINGGAFNTINQAYYAEDSWSLFADRLTLQLGLRNDRFDNRDAANHSFYKSGDQWGPRLGFTLDPLGGNRTKIYGSFSRYFLPIAANTNIRGAGSETDFTTYYQFNGIGPDGRVILGQPINNVVGGAACPGISGQTCTVIKNGEIQDPSSFQAQGLKPQSEDEYILGVEQRVGRRIKVGAYFTYRKLNEVLEDAAIDQAALRYCEGQGFSADACGQTWTGFAQYVLVNPGEDAAIKLLPLPDGTQPVVNFTAADLGYPKARRSYKAMTFTFDREFDGKWSLSGSYTLAASLGNYEGGVKSDIGQSDTGATEDFDQPGFTIGSYGFLPNHRRHQFKLYGSYQVSDWLNVGANMLVASPKKFGCLGIVPRSVDPFAAQYKGGGFFCQGQLVPRGSAFESDWKKEVDLTVQIRVPFDYDASVRFDVFNVLGDKSALDYQEIGDNSDGTPNVNYGKPLVYQEPRSVRIQLKVGF